MLASLLIIAFSVFLLGYWFRYSCLLLLRTPSQPVVEPQEAPDRRFSFVEVRKSIATASDLDPLRRALDRDYEILAFLAGHAAGMGLGSLEDRLLVLDYRMMQAWYRVTRSLFPGSARRALAEMAGVLDVLVRKMGGQADAYSKA